MKVLVASRNAKKLKELQRVLQAADVQGIELVSLADIDEYPESPETGATFVANAQIKTQDGVRYAGLPTIADDSGIRVDRLNGMPGVLSARWSGTHGDDAANNALLLAQLKDFTDPEERGAQFVSACVLQLPADLAEQTGMQEVYAVEGVWEGSLLMEEQGAGGFGYDPLFSPVEEPGRSAAELSPERKDELSHRGKALAQLVEPLRRLAQH
ncbi:non-canonical purine NTP pyrophosphatase [Corynebacterium sp. 320]|uniref:non-canonical purine NTP pyrophosphatase n=1 Tax=Corynebacterium TaxID=1716 RepID=UPI00125CCA80|nr:MULTISPECIES: non-canonical purine NTP pyrophosphatase [Corynebacterium]KAB1501433.1 non-canonical purine NTP pyrophosphatase [Corynebacterium sp. 320]KAB1551442.1 non-canonical purine NTP pyrophosphatase [Corynebacterium sp. 321]KAB1551730.1 non-canonical purine NTP pyrophosphatase [Corynebacterium sp. 319]KAB3525791.1 non-canonical purine NTP pyrophosphatase [Corynebacterium sp. 250]KAB3538720.1 non-canonical purine NTP pyrophosphatase [Corynebacterium sp. 366]